MKAVILAGGMGTRLREETEFRPKPMVEIGDRPILWHIMKHLSTFGITDFIIAVGYKGDIIKDYFLNYGTRNNDFTVQLGQRESLIIHGSHDESNWTVTLVDTGLDTSTGGRVKQAARYLDSQPFLVTYGDGLSNVDIGELTRFHEGHGQIGTVTLGQPVSRFGVAEVSTDGFISRFREKPQLDGWVNIGYFIFEHEFLVNLNDSSILEKEPLATLAAEGSLKAYRHRGYWQPMDTYKEAEGLNELWRSGQAPWQHVWNGTNALG